MTSGKKEGQTQEHESIADLAKAYIVDRMGIFPALLIFAVLGSAFFAWSKWADIREWPGVSKAVHFLTREDIPKADEDRFTIGVARIYEDDGNRLHQLISQLLRDVEGVQVLPLDRFVNLPNGPPEEAERIGHENAREYLRLMEADVLIWGQRVHYQGSSRPLLYMTPAFGGSDSRGFYFVSALRQYQLSESFWDDLSGVFSALVESMAYAIQIPPEGSNLQGYFQSLALRSQLVEVLAGRLEELLDYLEEISARDNERVRIRLAYASVLNAYGNRTQRRQALSVFQSALGSLSRDKDRGAWAEVNYQIGFAYFMQGTAAGYSQAIHYFRQCLDLPQEEDPTMTHIRASLRLGESLIRVAEQTKHPETIDEAVDALSATFDAVDDAQVQSSSRRRIKAEARKGLGRAYFLRAEIRRQDLDYYKSIRNYYSALDFWPERQMVYYRLRTHESLAHALLVQAKRRDSFAGLSRAFLEFLAICDYLHGQSEEWDGMSENHFDRCKAGLVEVSQLLARKLLDSGEDVNWLLLAARP